MRIAIGGTGVTGLVAAHLLNRRHEITVFEASDRVGGHVNTVDVSENGNDLAVDTGFIVYNELNYPNFSKLLRSLGVETQPSTMSFSVRLERPEFEYNGSTLAQLFAQRRNLLRPWFYRMLADILRFNRSAPHTVHNGEATATLGEYVKNAGFSEVFVDRYLTPMGAAIWSIPGNAVLDMPASFFVRFFQNHGMLTVDDRPEWRTIVGGSARYVERLIAPFADRIRLNTPVREIRRYSDHVTVNGEVFDHVILACHSDEALATLRDPSPVEESILGAIRYQINDVWLHTDDSLLPRRRRAWGAWNYHMTGCADDPVAVTYNMNMLQSLEADSTLCVTLNAAERIDPARVIGRYGYAHPFFSQEAVVAQGRHDEISGVRRTHYGGAYWGFGFHEDGVNSALKVCRAFGESL